MRALLLAFLLLGTSAAAAPSHVPAFAVESLDAGTLRSIRGWLRASGREGFLAGEVADVAGIPRARDEDMLDARQRGFRSGGVLRVAQAGGEGARDFLLFMVQGFDGSVTFFAASAREGLRRAFVTLPGSPEVRMLAAAEAQARFVEELRFWSARMTD